MFFLLMTEHLNSNDSVTKHEEFEGTRGNRQDKVERQ